jgi:hypothetical protein
VTVTYNVHDAIDVLSRTPAVLDAMLRGLPAHWTSGNEGPNTWSPFEVVAHLIHTERTNWIPRAEHLLAHGDAMPFPPFDRFAHLQQLEGQTLPDLLDSFRDVRHRSLERLRTLALSEADLSRLGRHPEFGPVTLSQLLATWVVHDLDHIVQISRVMARQYTDAVGPWRNYLRIIREA